MVRKEITQSLETTLAPLVITIAALTFQKSFHCGFTLEPDLISF